MKATVLARPNLKLFLLGAIFIAVLQHLLYDGDEVQARAVAVQVNPNIYLNRLLEEASAHPSAQLYGQISYAYEKRGDYKKAIVYFRAAQILAETEENN